MIGFRINPYEGVFPVPRCLFLPGHPLNPINTKEVVTKRDAIVDLFGLARWKAGDGLEASECRASCRFLGKRWNWSPTKVQRFLKGLEKCGVVEVRQVKGWKEPQIIRLLDYDRLRSIRSPVVEAIRLPPRVDGPF